VVVESSRVASVTAALTGAGETVWRLGDVAAGERGVEWTNG